MPTSPATNWERASRRERISRRGYFGRRMPVGFSLIELMVVIVLLALVSTVGAVSVAGPLDAARLARLADQLESADHRERSLARVSPVPGGIEFDRIGKRLHFALSNRTIDLKQTSIDVNDFWVAQPVTGGAPASSRRGSLVPYGQSGQSLTYAVKLVTRRQQVSWWVVLGDSGQTLVTTDEGKVRWLLGRRRST